MSFFHRGVQNVSSTSTTWGYTWDSTSILFSFMMLQELIYEDLHP